MKTELKQFLAALALCQTTGKAAEFLVNWFRMCLNWAKGKMHKICWIVNENEVRN
jgi:hypothetical protein